MERASKRNLALAAGAIVLVGAVAMIVVLWVPGPGGPSASFAPSEPAPALPDPVRPPLPSGARPFGVPPSPPPAYEPPPPRPPPGSWEAVPLSARPAALGAAGAAVNGILGDLQPALAGCLDEVTASRHGQTPFSRTTDFAGPEPSATPILVLEVETGSGQVRIVDAPVERQGGAADGAVACAQQVLRGRTAAAPGVQGGQRFRLTFPLTP